MDEPLAGLPAPAADAIEREVQAICKRYRVDADCARQALYAAFAARPELIEALRAAHPTGEVARLGAYKAAIKAARKTIYYHLRQYRRQGRDAGDAQTALAARLAAQVAEGAPGEMIRETCRALLATHASTAERDQDAFFRALFDLVPPPESIIDIGCGLQPLAYPFAARGAPLYVAVDREPGAIAVLQAFAPSVAPARLVALRAELADLDWAATLAFGVAEFDLALMLKLVPVIRRQQRDLLPLLAAVPTRRILITGNVEALTRRERIRPREDRALRAFVALTGRRVVGELETPGEFGYVLE